MVTTSRSRLRCAFRDLLRLRARPAQPARREIAQEKLPVEINHVMNGQMLMKGRWGTVACLDVETGRLVMFREELPELDPHDQRLAETFPDREQGLVEIAQAISAGNRRCQRIPRITRITDADERADRQRFAAAFADAALRTRLQAALASEDALGIGEFDHVPSSDDAEAERWSNERNLALRQRARAWLATFDIEPLPAPG